MVVSRAAAERIMIALDTDKTTALSLAQKLQGQAVWFKVGMTLFYAEGHEVVRELKDMGFKVFLDLKLHDIPHQVKGAARSLGQLGVDLITIHAAGGHDMIKAAREGLIEGSAPGHVPDLICITVLTSTDAEMLKAIGVSREMKEQVKALATLAKDAGAQGVVCSPQESSLMKELLGEDALIVTPGVRPKGADLQDQSRVMTPSEAILAGSTHLVIGRPITQADDPVAAFEAIAKEVEGAL